MGYERLDADAALIDGAGMVQMNAPNLAKINGETAKQKLEMRSMLDSAQRLDIIFDVYQKGS